MMAAPAPEYPAQAHILTGPDYLRRLLDLLYRAHLSVELCVYLAAPPGRDASRAYLDLWHALTHAPARGVTCRALLHTHPAASVLLRAHLTAATTLAAAGWRVRFTRPPAVQHAKFWIVDGLHALVGSHNLTESATTRNGEASVYLNAKTVARDLRWLFNRAWSRPDLRPHAI
jgi:phosphatidylserine/phosphatidylglycerophosphate/cardiolipin synthase-like enzyme